MRMAVLSSTTAWHFLDLKRAAGSRHEVFPIPFEELGANVGSQGVSSRHPVELEALSPVDAACFIVRTMPAGSLQQIIFRMDLLGQLADSGALVLNSPRSIEIAVDKYLTLARLDANGIPVPQTRVSQTADLALRHFRQLGSDVVVKPLFGSMGNGISRIQTVAAAARVFTEAVELGEVIYQQEFIPHRGFDVRILVIGETLLAMKRVNRDHWITNISQGGVGQEYDPSEAEKQMAIGAARAVGAHFAGVDLIYRPDSATPVVVEVNAVPGWKAISEVLSRDVAQLVIAEIETLACV